MRGGASPWLYIYDVKEMKVMQNYYYNEGIKLVDSNRLSRNSKIGKNENNDCVVRAIACGFDMDYDKAHKFVEKHFNRKFGKSTYGYVEKMLALRGKTINKHSIKKVYITSSWIVNSDNMMSHYKKKKVKVITNPEYKKPTGFTVGSFIKNYPIGRFILEVKGHVLTVIDGIVFGNWDDNRNLSRRLNTIVEIK
jgi:hypothetical protein